MCWREIHRQTKDNDYYVLDHQISDLVLVTLVQFHRTAADKLVDGRVGCRWMCRLTFVCGCNLIGVSHFTAIFVIFYYDSILVNSFVQN
jgi:hypothetical protein